MINIILGPPGTGKTTKLLDICRQKKEQGVFKIMPTPLEKWYSDCGGAGFYTNSHREVRTI